MGRSNEALRTAVGGVVWLPHIVTDGPHALRGKRAREPAHVRGDRNNYLRNWSTEIDHPENDLRVYRAGS
jgi:hypothetical protein